ncbi:hypothetical protein Bca4012_025188 [Brassica carinata]
MEFSNTITCSHYNNKQKILLVGEGDFSFSLCLAKAFGSATNITATSLDTREELEQKYRDAKNNVEELERRGCTVIHGVNVHSMDKDHRVVRSIVYDRIIFNFPHAGFHFGREIDSYTILQHQEVVKGFFLSARELVDASGEIHVTHKVTPTREEVELAVILASLLDYLLLSCLRSTGSFVESVFSGMFI